MYSKSYAGSEDGLIENTLTPGPALPKWCTPHFPTWPSVTRPHCRHWNPVYLSVGRSVSHLLLEPFDLRTWLAEEPSVTK